ncbi:MAG TPA: hypothetical protein EYQ78_04895 [Candidatus Poseidoniales archaeon]|jgi:hypothetical protein|nr:hypothetical protein [Candidatus Poseidoniales archaeon]
MERRYPKIGKLAMVISISQFLGVLLNGILGLFPAGLIGSGSRGQKFHLLQYIRQTLNLPYKEGGFWSDAGSFTGQEFAMIFLMVVTLVIAIIGLRQRESIAGPSKISADSQREQLESGQVSVSKPGGLSVVNPTTAAIVSNIVGGGDTPAADIIADALGEMKAVALEMGVDDELIKGQIIQEETEDITLDSHDTVTSTYDDTEVIDLTESIVESTEQDVQDEEVSENDELGWLDDSPWSEDDVTINSEEISVPETKEKPSLPSLPSTPTKQSIPKPVVVEVKTPPVENKYVKPVETPVVPQVKEAQSGAMPTRPSGLPDKAVFDIELNSWTLFGRPIEFTDAPPMPVIKKERKTAPTPATNARTPPSLPTIPTPPKKESKPKPRLPSIPQI